MHCGSIALKLDFALKSELGHSDHVALSQERAVGMLSLRTATARVQVRIK